MDVLDLFEVLATWSRRLAVAMILVFIGCFLAWPTPTFNVSWNQMLRRSANLTNLVAPSMANIRCSVTQDGWTARPTIDCSPID